MAAKSADAFRTISEVAEWLGTPTHVLRFWESKFSQVKPVKRAGGRRYYRPADMKLLGGIKKLLHEDGMTIKGVQKLLRENGIRYVAAMSQPLDDDLERLISPTTAGQDEEIMQDAPDAPDAPAVPDRPIAGDGPAVPVRAFPEDVTPSSEMTSDTARAGNRITLRGQNPAADAPKPDGPVPITARDVGSAVSEVRGPDNAAAAFVKAGASQRSAPTVASEATAVAPADASEATPQGRRSTPATSRADSGGLSASDGAAARPETDSLAVDQQADSTTAAEPARAAHAQDETPPSEPAPDVPMQSAAMAPRAVPDSEQAQASPFAPEIDAAKSKGEASPPTPNAPDAGPPPKGSGRLPGFLRQPADDGASDVSHNNDMPDTRDGMQVARSLPDAGTVGSDADVTPTRRLSLKAKPVIPPPPETLLAAAPGLLSKLANHKGPQPRRAELAPLAARLAALRDQMRQAGTR